MVFISTLQYLFYNARPLDWTVLEGSREALEQQQRASMQWLHKSRQFLFAFGQRPVTSRLLLEEIVMGCTMVLPLAVLFGLLVARISTTGRQASLAPWWSLRKYLSAEWITTLVITIAGDLILELLLPSAQCIPMHPTEIPLTISSTLTNADRRFLWNELLSDSMSYPLWLARTWGFSCPEPPSSSNAVGEYFAALLFAAPAVGILLAVRLFFVAAGAFLGEAFVPVALTGSIATGKSTVAKLFQQPQLPPKPISTVTDQTSSSSADATTGAAMSPSNNSMDSGGSHSKRNIRRKSKTQPQQQQQSSSSSTSAGESTNFGGETTAYHAASESCTEGTFLIIDADSIAHEILLPPAVLAGDTSLIASTSSPNSPLRSKRHQQHHQQHQQPTSGVGKSKNSRHRGNDDDDHNHHHQDSDDDGDGEDHEDTGGTSFTVLPHESVYDQVIATFSELLLQSDSSSPNEGDVKNNSKSKKKAPQRLEFLDQNDCIDRRKLGAIVFTNPRYRRALNHISHPRLLQILIKRLFAGVYIHSTNSPYLLLLSVLSFLGIGNNQNKNQTIKSRDIICADIPLLFESGYLRLLFAITVVVACTDEDLQFQRLRLRNPDLTEEQCWDRIKCQMPMSTKIAKADIVIFNNGTAEELAHQVEMARAEIMGRIYGIGMSLSQMIVLVGGTLTVAIAFKLYA